MNRIAKSIFCLLVFATPFCSSAVTLYSIASGSWSNTAIWSYTPGGASCGCIPASSDNIIINHNILLDHHLTNGGSNLNGITGTLTINAGASLSGGNTYDIDIRAGGTLNLCGTLVARDVIFSNGSFVNVCPAGTLTVNGNFENKNNSDDVVINGNMTVGGSFTNGNGGVISGSGTISVINGPVNNTGTAFGCEGVGCSVFPCGFSAGNCGGVPLPIDLVSFSIECNSSGRTLSWTTATEINNDYFTIERSEDAIVFTGIATVRGAGTSSHWKNYTWTDDTDDNGKIIYYRLRQTDYDANTTISQVLSAQCRRKEKQPFLYPNPCSDFVTLSGTHFFEGSTLCLKDLMGKTVLEQKPDAGAGAILDVRNLSNGIYLLFIDSNSPDQNLKLVISR